MTNNTLYSKNAGWNQSALYATAWSSQNILSSQTTAVNAGYYEAQTVAVGRLAPNGFGLYDTLGNVLEACSDFSADSTYVWPDDEIVRNPVGIAESFASVTSQGIKKHIFRGGSIDNSRTYSTLRSRFSVGAYTQNSAYGFRVICTVP